MNLMQIAVPPARFVGYHSAQIVYPDLASAFYAATEACLTAALKAPFTPRLFSLRAIHDRYVVYMQVAEYAEEIESYYAIFHEGHGFVIDAIP